LQWTWSTTISAEGNYLPNSLHVSRIPSHPLGQAINFDGPESDGIRRWLSDNALYWLTEYHVDALRLTPSTASTISALITSSDELRSIPNQAHASTTAWIIAESDLEDVASLIPAPPEVYAAGCAMGRRLPSRPLFFADPRKAGLSY